MKFSNFKRIKDLFFNINEFTILLRIIGASFSFFSIILFFFGFILSFFIYLNFFSFILNGFIFTFLIACIVGFYFFETETQSLIIENVQHIEKMFKNEFLINVIKNNIDEIIELNCMSLDDPIYLVINKQDKIYYLKSNNVKNAIIKNIKFKSINIG